MYLSTTLSTLQAKLTNLNNITNVFKSADALMINFTPTDTISWVLQAGSYSNNAQQITNTWGYVENNAQQLTLTASTTGDLYFRVSTSGYVGQTVILKCWVELGSAQKFNMSATNTLAWSSVGGITYTSLGLSTSAYTQVSFTFVVPSTSYFDVSVGGHGNGTTYNQVA